MAATTFVMQVNQSLNEIQSIEISLPKQSDG